MDINNKYCLWGGIVSVSTIAILISGEMPPDFLRVIEYVAIVSIGAALFFIIGAVIGSMATEKSNNKWIALAKFIGAMVVMVYAFCAIAKAI